VATAVQGKRCQERDGADHPHFGYFGKRRNRIKLAVLADALEDAGCTDADILSHLRSGGEHVLGCWAVDTLLGKN
jgi:hypothetical protein